MAKINIHFRGNKMDLTPSIEEHVAKKVSALEKYTSEENGPADLYIELGKLTEHHKQGNIFRAEFNFNLGGRQIRSETEAADLYSAIEGAKDEMVEELRTLKDKDTTIFRRGARAIKEMIRKVSGGN